MRNVLAAIAFSISTLLGVALIPDATDTGNVIRTTASYTIRPMDAVVMADATAGAITVTLPAAPGLYMMKQHRVCKTDSSTNAVTVQDGSGFSRALRNQDSCATFMTNRASSTQTSVAAGGEKWVAVADAGPYIIKGTVTLNPSSVAAGAVASQLFNNIPIIRTTDTLVLNPPNSANTLVIGQVYPWTVDGEFVVVLYNPTGSPIDLASDTWIYTIIRNP